MNTDQSNSSTMIEPTADRRDDQRVTLDPAYSPVQVRRLNDMATILPGHAYDISPTGSRFELDESLEPGERIQIEIDSVVCKSTLKTTGTIQWISSEDDDPGPRRMAVEFDTLQDSQRISLGCCRI